MQFDLVDLRLFVTIAESTSLTALGPARVPGTFAQGKVPIGE